MTEKNAPAGEDARLKEKYQTIYDLLLQEYGQPEWRQHLPPVDELVKGVNIALGLLDVSECEAFDRNGDGSVTVDELVAGVNYALNGCPAS